MIFRKNIMYQWKDFELSMVIEQARRDPDSLVDFMQMIERSLGSPGLQEASMKLLHVAAGVQYIVQKNLSDELRQVDFDNSHFEDIAWPAPTIEMYFEDPELPTVIVAHSRYEGLLYELAKAIWPLDYRKHCPTFGIFGGPSLGACADNTKANTSCTVVHDFDTWNDALKDASAIPETSPDAILKQSPEEQQQLHAMLNLSLKVIAYSNMPQFIPEPVTRKQMGRGPKPGVCGRPVRPALRTVYLPRVIRPSSNGGEGGTGTREFKGRRGHIRHLRSEFYKEKRGQWIYVPPVIVEGTGKDILYKVRKV